MFPYKLMSVCIALTLNNQLIAPRKGIGRKIIEAIIARVAAFNPKEVVVLTLAPEFFAALGFREIPKTQIMHKLYTGCINCTKHTDPFTCPEIAMRRDMEH